jgi:AmmeMemoRadiSam system protein B
MAPRIAGATIWGAVILLCATGWSGGCKKKKNRQDPRAGEAEGGRVGSRNGEKPPAGSLAAKLFALDRGTLPYLRKLDGPGLLEYRKRTGITVCGVRAVALMLSALKQTGKPIGMRVLDYYTSARMSGDWENTVSYYSIVFYEKNTKGSAGGGKKAKGESSGETGTGDAGERSAPGGGDGATTDPSQQRMRPMATGPGWYPKTSAKLKKQLARLLGRVEVPAINGRVVALISPHAGYRYSGEAAAHGFKLLKKQPRIARAVVLGISHRTRLRGISVAPYTHYATPLGPIPVDRKAAGALLQHEVFGQQRRAHTREHSVELQLPFLRYLAPQLRLVPLLVGWLSVAQLSAAGARLAKLMDANTIFIASTDFTHRGPRFGYRPFADKAR